MHRQKVRSIVKNFKEKLKRNNCESKPVEYDPYETVTENSFFNREGLILKKYFKILLAFITIFQIMFLIFVFSVSVLYNELRREPFVQSFCIL